MTTDNKPYTPPDWISQPLESLNQAQWEALCDGCGKCCLHKYYADEEDIERREQDPDFPPDWLNHEFVYSQMTCELYDVEGCGCSDYHNRQTKMPDCVPLNSSNVKSINWLPTTCAYRLRQQGEPLPDWHPLISGDPETVKDAGVAIQSWAVEFNHVDDPLDYLVDFIP